MAVGRQGGTVNAVAPADARVREQQARTARRSGRSVLVFRLVAIVVAMVLPLLLLEGALRAFGPILPGNYDTGHYLQRHPTFGHFNVPNFDGWIKTSEFTTRVQISPLGLRDPRTTYERPKDVFRVLLLGDSFVEGVQVAQSQTVAAQLERLLTERAGRPVEVVNAGVAGYGTGQELLLFQQEGVKYQPNVVVVVVFLGNDIGDNSYRPNPTLAEQTSRPSFELDPERLIRVVPGAPIDTSYDVRQSLRACCLLYNVFETGVLMKMSAGAVRDQPEVTEDARYLVRSLYERNPDAEMERAWKITERLLGLLRDRAASESLQLLVVSAPDWLALDEGAWQERMGDARTSSRRYAQDVPSKALAEIATKAKMHFVDLLPIFEREQAGGALYFPIDTHWTPRGHTVAAEAIGAKLREMNLDGR